MNSSDKHSSGLQENPAPDEAKPESPGKYDPNSHYSYLDGIRGVAVILVLIGHTSNAKAHIIPGLSFAGTGKVGVWMFFTLSAFLLGAKLLRKYEREADDLGVTAAYFIGRLARIYPLYIVAIAVYGYSGRLDLESMARHYALLEGRSIFWAIPVEFKFYFVLPIIVWALARFRPSFNLALAIMLAANAAISLYFPRESYPLNTIILVPYFPIFLWGILAAYHVHLKKPSDLLGVSNYLLLILIVLLTPPAGNSMLWLGGFSQIANKAYHSLGTLHGLLFSLLVVQALSVGWMRRAFTSQALIFTGKISFSLYLWHIIILETAVRLSWLPHGLAGAFTIVATYAVSAATYFLIEKPGMELGKQITGKMEKR